MVLSNVWGSFGGNGIPGSELYIFENNLEEEKEYITAKHLGFVSGCLGSNPSFAT